MDKKFGVAVIGYGGMGGWHVKKLLSLKDEGIELRGVYDIKPERNQAAEEAGVHAYASREELLSDPSIDLVTVAIPNDMHHEVCIDAMRHGKNVVSEKPVTMKRAPWARCSILNPVCMVPAESPVTGAIRKSTAAGWCSTGAFTFWTRSCRWSKSRCCASMPT